MSQNIYHNQKTTTNAVRRLIINYLTDSRLEHVETVQKSVLDFQVVHGGQGSVSAVLAAAAAAAALLRHELHVSSEVAVRCG